MKFFKSSYEEYKKQAKNVYYESEVDDRTVELIQFESISKVDFTPFDTFIPDVPYPKPK